MIYKHEELIVRLNSIGFFGFENYHFGGALEVLLEYFDIDKYEYVKLLNVPIYEDTFHVKESVGRVMFLYSNSYKGRKDLEEFFLKVANLLDNKIVLMPNRGEIRKDFSVKEKVLMGMWILQMRKTGLSLKEKIFCANLLISGKRNLDKIVKIIEKGRIRSIVTLCDVHLIDYMVTVYCNQHSIRTATLQHGFFMENDECYQYSESNYFLTYSEYTKKLYYRCNKFKGNCIVAGMPEYIGENKIQKRNSRERERFLVLLNGSSESEYIRNKKMLKICMEYAEKDDCLFDVRPHPDTKNEYLKEYRSIISTRGKIIRIVSDVSELFDNYNFCVANRTTMVLKSIYTLTPVLLFKQKGEKMFFGIHNEKLYFSDYLEMKKCIFDIVKGDSGNIWLELRENLCGSGDITQNYVEILRKL